MLLSAGARLFTDLRDAVTRHLTLAATAFCACILLGALGVVVWPGGAPLAVPVTAVIAALTLACAVPWQIDRRNPYFRTREDVQDTLNLPVLAVYPERSRGVYSERSR